MDKFNEMLPAMQEKMCSPLQKQIDSVVSHLVNMKKEFLDLQENVKTIESKYRVTNVALEELKQQQDQQQQQQQKLQQQEQQRWKQQQQQQWQQQQQQWQQLQQQPQQQQPQQEQQQQQQQQ